MKQKNIKGILLVLGMILLLLFVFFTNHNNKESNNLIDKSELNISRSEINRFVLSQQNSDGGFNLITPNIDLDLENTFYAVESLQMMDKETDFQDTKEYIRELDIRQFLHDDNIYNAKSSYYYLALHDLLDLEISENSLKQILFFWESHQDDNGYIYNLKNEEKKIGRDYLNDVYYLETLLYGHQILSIYGNNTTNLSLQKEFINAMDFTDYSRRMVALITTFLELSNLYSYDNTTLKPKLENYLQNYINWGLQENATTVADVSVIANYIDYDVNNILINIINQLERQNGYSIDKNIEDIHIKATNLILQVLNDNEMNIDKEKENHIYDFIKREKNYNGTYLFRDFESNLFSSYYAIKILDRLNNVDQIDHDKLTKFLQNQMHTFGNLSTPEQLFYMKISRIIDYKINNDINIDDYFKNQFDILKKADIGKNAELIILLLETAKMYDYNISEEIRTTIIDKIDNYEEKEFYKIIQLINHSNLIYLKTLIDEQVEDNELKHLILEFEENINEWDDMLYAFQKVFKHIDNKKMNMEFSSATLSLVLEEIDRRTENGLYKYSSADLATFDSVYELLNILMYYQEKDYL